MLPSNFLLKNYLYLTIWITTFLCLTYPLLENITEKNCVYFEVFWSVQTYSDIDLSLTQIVKRNRRSDCPDRYLIETKIGGTEGFMVSGSL